MALIHSHAVFVAQQIFQKDFQGKRQTIDVAKGVGCFGQAVIMKGFPTSSQAGKGIQAVFAKAVIRHNCASVLRRDPSTFTTGAATSDKQAGAKVRECEVNYYYCIE